MSDMVGWAMITAVSVVLVAGGEPATDAPPDEIGPVIFRCDDGSEIVATFLNTPPARAMVTRGDQQLELRQARSGSGARYVGDDVTFWNKGRDAMVEWQGRHLDCTTAE